MDLKSINNQMGNFYDNSATCGNCNGNGCRQCDDAKLAGPGRTRFPESQMINGCKPPYIQNPYAWNLHPVLAAYIIADIRINNQRNVRS